MSYLVFISHASDDGWIARQMAAVVERRAKRYGVRTFLDEKDLKAGASIPEEVRRHLEICEEFIVLLTAASGCGMGDAQTHHRGHRQGGGRSAT